MTGISDDGVNGVGEAKHNDGNEDVFDKTMKDGMRMGGLLPADRHGPPLLHWRCGAQNGLKRLK